MRGFRELKRAHPDAYALVQVRVRRAVGSTDIDGPYDKLRMELLVAISVGGALVHSREGRDAMRACLAILRPDQSGEDNPT